MLTELVNAGTVKLHYHVIAILNRASTTLYSSRAANAGYFAADAGVFERYHNLLFANQPPELDPDSIRTAVTDALQH
jgi:hypothetical protein